MRRGILLLGLGWMFLGCVHAAAMTREENNKDLKLKAVNPMYAFEQWVIEQGAEYMKGTEEWMNRYRIWVTNLHKAIDYNDKTESHWLTMNKFADLTEDEFQERYLGMRFTVKSNEERSPTFMHGDVDLHKVPEKVDWRDHGAVTNVKNQESCGSCWSFSTTGAIEGANALYSGGLISLSEQELVDCDTAKDSGCDGGWMDYAFEWVIGNGGITTEKDYPYEANDGRCNPVKKSHHIVSIDSYEDVPQGEHHLIKAVSKQPVSVAMQAYGLGLQLYGGGIYDGYCGTDLDHGVMAVGYSREPGNSYFTIKNSWGPYWGEDGYIRLAFGKNGDNGQCGIYMAASYPIKTSPNPKPEPEPKPEPGPEPEPKPEPEPEPEPSPPGPPVICNIFTECDSGETCCCDYMFLGVCVKYSCCPFEDAVCCADAGQCCPSEHPICEASNKKCSSVDGLTSVPMGQKRMALAKWPWGSDVEDAESSLDSVPPRSRFAVT